MSGNVITVYISTRLLKQDYISDQCGTAVYHYVRKCKDLLSINLIKSFTLPDRLVLSAI